MAIRVYLACCGLGRVNRGYESFARELTEALRDAPEIELKVFKGGGAQQKNQYRVWNLPRSSRAAKWVGDRFGREPYFIEELSFFLAFAPRLLLGRPDVVLTSDLEIGKLLWTVRKITRSRYRILFSNGGPIFPPFRKCDHQHQVAPTHYNAALEHGLAPETQTLLPYGVQMPATFRALSPDQRAQLRSDLKLPADRTLLLSVGALDMGHKRMGYTIREVAALSQTLAPEARPFLLLLGQTGPESDAVKALGKELLGDLFEARTVPHTQVEKYYQAADVFVLSSLSEGLARVFLESMAHGLPAVIHDYDITRYAFGDGGFYGDFREPGGLVEVLGRVLEDERNEDETTRQARREARFQRALECFSWSSLRARYIDMIERCAKS